MRKSATLNSLSRKKAFKEVPPSVFFFLNFSIRTYFLSWRITTGCSEDVCVHILSLKLSFLSLGPDKQRCSKVLTDIRAYMGKQHVACGT